MSYEGREEHLCKNGHRWMIDCRYAWIDEEPVKCPAVGCTESSVWCHAIDDTNCDAVGFIPEEEWKKMLIEPAKVEECDKCHHVKVVAEERYRIPTKAQLWAMETITEDGHQQPLNKAGKL